MSISIPVRFKIEKKKHVLQFVPQILLPLTKIKKVSFNGKLLKTAKIIDLTHVIISKYYYREKDYFNLSSTILRENYGTFYNYYIDYLIEQKIISLNVKYFQGKKCNTYLINSDIFSGGMYRWANTDKIIVAKWKKKMMQYQLDNLMDIKIIDPWVKRRLFDDLWHVNIDIKGAIGELDELYESGELSELAYWKNKSSIQAIDDDSIFFKEDDYGRLHTNFTILKKVIRSKYLTIDGEEVAELDIKNSQPMFLAIFLKEQGFDQKHPVEYNNFIRIVKSGTLYDQFATVANISRKDAKMLVYNIFFGQNKLDKNNNIFRSVYPYIWYWMVDYKNGHKNYKILSWELQSRESRLIFDNICNRIKRENEAIRLFTVHDSIFYPAKYKELVEDIFYKQVDSLFG